MCITYQCLYVVLDTANKPQSYYNYYNFKAEKSVNQNKTSKFFKILVFCGKESFVSDQLHQIYIGYILICQNEV